MFSPDGKMPKDAPAFELSLLAKFNENVIKNPNIDLSKTYTDEFVNAAK